MLKHLKKKKKKEIIKMFTQNSANIYKLAV